MYRSGFNREKTNSVDTIYLNRYFCYFSLSYLVPTVVFNVRNVVFKSFKLLVFQLNNVLKMSRGLRTSQTIKYLMLQSKFKI